MRKNRRQKLIIYSFKFFIVLIGISLLSSCNDDVVTWDSDNGNSDNEDDNIVLVQNIDYDSIATKFAHTSLNTNYNLDVNKDSIPDFRIDMQVFTGEIGVLWFYLEPKAEQWHIASISMSDTISIDTTFLGPNGLYSTTHTYYDSEVEDSWQEIKTYQVPFIADESNISCSDLNFSNEKLLVYENPFFTMPPGQAFAYDYINPGIKYFNGYILVQNNYQCFSIKAIYDGSILELGTPKPISL